MANKVYDEKDEVLEEKVEFNIFDILNKNNLLSVRELVFLYILVLDASNYLSSIQNYSDDYNELIDDFSIDDYPIDIFNCLEDMLYEDMSLRKENNNIMLLKRK